MIRFPNSKINLGLHVIAKRQDGYHDIETIFYPVNCCDILEFLPTEDTASISTTGLPVAGNDQSNLCLKAYQLIKEVYAIPSVRIHLHKIIPMGAGLGGGSSDGAFMLRMLADYFSLGISEKELEVLALKLGSDCPFFIANKPVLAKGRGDCMESVSVNLKGYFIILLKPDVHIATAEAFGGVTPAIPLVSMKEMILTPVETWKDWMINDFERTVGRKFPVIMALKKNLFNAGALYASMTGSGSAVYGIFREVVTDFEVPSGVFCWKGFLD